MRHAEKIAGGVKVPFGLDKDKIATDLQRLSDGLRAGSILPQAITSITRNVADDFEMVTLELTYAEMGGSDEPA